MMVCETCEELRCYTDATGQAAGPAALSASRQRILEIASVIVPGHGPAFRPGERTPG